ncbi:hypothetical protein [Halostagnicola sp. A-GB9-2]|uniref:hypothetical protein n=1 Tax=Halostagnicola sp. A-GB9-2 TaxID=3048066 RepID=UPI0024C0D537|nr:hypothetical protein [Halostagnicola sp. A-GB9-2]MDJ1431657.1 hypothetical protein [Halostagnicola sp. A-GB9-2]
MYWDEDEAHQLIENLEGKSGFEPCCCVSSEWSSEEMLEYEEDEKAEYPENRS